MRRSDEKSWSGAVGRIDAALLASAAPKLTADRVHICGPEEMMETTKAILLELGVPRERIKTEAFGTVKHSPVAKRGSPTETAGKVVFQTSETTAIVRSDETILDAADNADVSIDNACRSGTCGSCRIKLLLGKVTMGVEDALTREDKADGYILACQAKIQGDVKVDA